MVVNLKNHLEGLNKRIHSVYEKFEQEHRAQRESEYATMVDISESVGIFKHLKLDEEYRLYAYTKMEYHGLCGFVVALDRNVQPPKILKRSAGIFDCIQGSRPKEGITPLEVIFSDGSPEGCFEAVVFEELLEKIAKLNEEPLGNDFIFSEEDMPNVREFICELKDWTPKHYVTDGNYSALLQLCSHKRGRVSLNQYKFSDSSLWISFAWHKKETKHVDLKKRYGDGKHCCLFKKQNICIATYPYEEDDWN